MNRLAPAPRRSGASGSSSRASPRSGGIPDLLGPLAHGGSWGGWANGTKVPAASEHSPTLSQMRIGHRSPMVVRPALRSDTTKAVWRSCPSERVPTLMNGCPGHRRVDAARHLAAKRRTLGSAGTSRRGRRSCLRQGPFNPWLESVVDDEVSKKRVFHRPAVRHDQEGRHDVRARRTRSPCNPIPFPADRGTAPQPGPPQYGGDALAA